MKCPACEHENPPEALSCMKCGKSLVDETSHADEPQENVAPGAAWMPRRQRV